MDAYTNTAGPAKEGDVAMTFDGYKLTFLARSKGGRLETNWYNEYGVLVRVPGEMTLIERDHDEVI